MSIPILIVVELISVFVARVVPNFMALSDALKSIASLFMDLCRIIANKASTYINISAKNDGNPTEERSDGVNIDYITPQRLKDYIRYNRASEIFKKTNNYPIADTNDPNVIKELLKLEEDFDIHFGEVYRSNYHTMVVDPISAGKDKNGKDKNYYAYERLLSPKQIDSSNVKESEFGRGVVIVSRTEEKFILLEQERHAIREHQIAFPRGFSECEDVYEDLKRELKEELGVCAPDHVEDAEREWKYKVIGQICPDSGAQGTFATVCYIEIPKCENQSGHEGIIGVKEVSEDQLCEMIKNGKINDGFTLGAYVLYQQKNSI